jgi:hypothetical protein
MDHGFMTIQYGIQKVMVLEDLNGVLLCLPLHLLGRYRLRDGNACSRTSTEGTKDACRIIPVDVVEVGIGKITRMIGIKRVKPRVKCHGHLILTVRTRTGTIRTVRRRRETRM